MKRNLIVAFFSLFLIAVNMFWWPAASETISPFFMLSHLVALMIVNLFFLVVFMKKNEKFHSRRQQ